MQGNTAETIEQLSSGTVSETIAALRQVEAIIDQLLAASITALERLPDRIFVAEALSRLGSAIVPYAKRSLERNTDRELRFWLALLILNYDQSLGAKVVLETLHSGDRTCSCLAVTRLSQHGIKEAGPVIIDLLRRVSVDDNDTIQCLLLAARRLSLSLPFDAVARLMDSTAPEIMSLFEDADVTHPSVDTRT